MAKKPRIRVTEADLPVLASASPSMRRVVANASVAPDGDMLFARMAQAAAKGGSIGFPASKARDRIRGIGLPSLSLWYLFAANILPFSRVIQIVGATGSCKTAFLFELYRWFGKWSGMGGFNDNETKDSAVLRDSIIRDEAILNLIDCQHTDDIESWMALLYAWIGEADAVCGGTSEKKGCGWNWPLLYGHDSLMSTQLKAKVEEMKNTGYKQDYARHAPAIYQFFRTYPPMLRDRPVVAAFTNHCNVSTDKQGHQVRQKPGGNSIGYMETTEIDMQRIADIDTSSQAGIRIRFKMMKNSLGPSRRLIVVNMLWTTYADPITGMTRQLTMWDWPAATIDMLLARQKYAGMWKNINEIVDIHKINNNKAWSNELGVPKEKATTFSRLGRLLEARADIVLALCPILGIHHFGEFMPGIDYATQLTLPPSPPRGIAHGVYGETPSLAMDMSEFAEALGDMDSGVDDEDESDVEEESGDVES